MVFQITGKISRAALRVDKRDCFNRCVLLIVLMGFFLILFLNQSVLAKESLIWPKIGMTEPKERKFTITKHYWYREQMYDPPVNIEFLQESPAFHSGPEALLISQISAMKALNYDWWLNTWDSVSKLKIIDRVTKLDKSKEVWRNQWQNKFEDKKVLMVRWIETGTYVILTYKLVASNNEQKESAVVFKLDEGKWVATLDLEDDPVLRYFGEKNSLIKRVIR